MAAKNNPGIAEFAIKFTAILFAGFIVAAVSLNVYYVAWSFVIVFLFGVSRSDVASFGYWLCLIGGVATSLWLMRKLWIGPVRKPVPRNEETSTETTAKP